MMKTLTVTILALALSPLSEAAANSEVTRQVQRTERSLILYTRDAGQIPVPIDHINMRDTLSNASIYSWTYETSPRQPKEIIEVTFDGNARFLPPNGWLELTVTAVNGSTLGGNSIVTGDYVLQIPKDTAYSNQFKVGEKWTIASTEWVITEGQPDRPNVQTQARAVEDRVIIIREEVASPSITSRLDRLEAERYNTISQPQVVYSPYQTVVRYEPIRPQVYSYSYHGTTYYHRPSAPLYTPCYEPAYTVRRVVPKPPSSTTVRFSTVQRGSSFGSYSSSSSFSTGRGTFSTGRSTTINTYRRP